MGVFFCHTPKIMSLYAEFLNDAKEMIDDFGVDGSCNSGAITFKCLISDPALTQTFEAGGFCDKTQHSVRIVAETASWSLPDGSNGASAATLISGQPIASLAIGKKVVAGGRTLRITGRTYKPGSCWITLTVIDDAE